ncbi:MAG: NAD-dependent epimerase/dehydratase family protein [Longimicrobiales bacterium]
MANKVLVTGGAGFIGGHIARAYLDRGDRVWVVDDLSTGKRANLDPRADFVETSIASRAVTDLFAKVGGFDLVNHHAAQIDVRKSVMDPRADAESNIIGLLNLLEAARRHGTRRFLFVSSGGVIYGEPEHRPTPETAPKQPLSPYGVSKLTAEYYLFYYHSIHGLDYIAQRYSNVYGPRQDPHGEAGVVAIFSNRLLAGQDLTIYGDGEQTRDYVFVEDVVRANLLLSEATLTNGTQLDDRAFNVGTGVETSVNALADVLIEHSGQRARRVHAAQRAGELRRSCLANARLRELGWAPNRSLPEGLRITYDYIQAKERKG